MGDVQVEKPYQCTRCALMFWSIYEPFYHEYVTWTDTHTGNNEPPPDAARGKMYFCPMCAKAEERPYDKFNKTC